MIKEIIMPKLGETMEEGYINKWLKKEGDRVKKGEVILEIMSDKTNFEVESQYDGYLKKILVHPSDKPVPVTTVIGYITDSLDEEIPETKTVEKTTQPQEPSAEKPVKQVEKDIVTEKTRIIASPVAKKLASEFGIDLSKIKGTGEGGRIEKKDVENYISQVKAMTEEKKIESLTPVRQIIAERLLWSKQNIPHYYLSTKIIMDSIEQLKKETQQQGKDFTYTDFILYFVSRTLEEFPLLNASFFEGKIVHYDSIDIGLAVNTENGLVVPVLKNVSSKKLDEISQLRIELATRAKNGQLKKQDTENCRFVLTNLGMFGVMQFQAIINPPGTAILAIGSIEKEPVVKDENIVIGKTMWATLSLDHRVIDGAYGGAFLKRLKTIMENPGILAI